MNAAGDRVPDAVLLLALFDLYLTIERFGCTDERDVKIMRLQERIRVAKEDVREAYGHPPRDSYTLAT